MCCKSFLLYTCEISAGKLSVCQDLGISIMTMRYEDIPSSKISIIRYQVNVFCKYIFFEVGLFLPLLFYHRLRFTLIPIFKKEKKMLFLYHTYNSSTHDIITGRSKSLLSACAQEESPLSKMNTKKQETIPYNECLEFYNQICP